MRGRPFGFLGLLCAVWITSRIGFLSTLPATDGQIANLRRLGNDHSVPVKHKAATAPVKAAMIGCCEKVSAAPGVRRSKILAAVVMPAPNSPVRIVPAIPLRISDPAPELPQLTTWATPAPSTLSTGFGFYIYQFHRGGAQADGLDGGERYGGSQSGFVATYALSRTDRVALLVRGAIAHDRLAERELAAGVRIQPFLALPVSITAERRFRNARRDAFAVYLAGGKSSVALPLRFKADAFAQVGVVTGKGSGALFDLAARAERPLTEIGNLPVTAGTGIWGGGQKGVFRIDAGPTIGTEIPFGEMRLRVSADWRFRIAGDARPASGPALTLSTGF